MLIEHIQSLRLLAVILDDNAAASNNLAGVASFVDLAKTNPFSKFLVIINLEILKSHIGHTANVC